MAASTTRKRPRLCELEDADDEDLTINVDPRCETCSEKASKVDGGHTCTSCTRSYCNDCGGTHITHRMMFDDCSLCEKYVCMDCTFLLHDFPNEFCIRICRPCAAKRFPEYHHELSKTPL